MGYLNEVMISTTTEGYEIIKNKIKNATIEPQIEDIDLRSDSVVFGWNRTKWDESYPEVSQTREALEILDEKGIPWELVRNGEDDSDVERLIGKSNLPTRWLDVKISYDSNNDQINRCIQALEETICFLQENEEYGDDWQDVIDVLADLQSHFIVQQKKQKNRPFMGQDN